MNRKFHILDAMVLVAAVAGGLALDSVANRPLASTVRQIQSVETYRAIRSVISRTTPILLAVTIACLALRLRGPGRSLRRLARTPGSMALVSASTVIALEYLIGLIQTATGTHPNFVINPVGASFDMNPGLAVAGAWMTLAMGGRWHSDRTWIDRAGLGLGVGWVALALVWLGSFGLVR
jgi:hypothetical protein